MDLAKHGYGDIDVNMTGGYESTTTVFTNPPLNLAAGHCGLGHGSSANAPDGYYLIESSNPNIAGFDDAVIFYVVYLYQLAK